MVVVEQKGFGVNFTDEEIQLMSETQSLLSNFNDDLEEIGLTSYYEKITLAIAILEEIKSLDDDSIQPEPEPEPEPEEDPEPEPEEE